MDPKYRSQSIWVCCRNANIFVAGIERTISGTCSKDTQNIIYYLKSFAQIVDILSNRFQFPPLLITFNVAVVQVYIQTSVAISLFYLSFTC